MIVTCPQCSAKYRVRDEAIPVGGAELECPECSAHFIAHPPSTEDLNRAIDKLTDAKTTLEARLDEKSSQLEAAKQEADELQAQLERLRAEGAQAIQMRDDELARLKSEVASKTNELGHLGADIGKLRTAAEEGARWREQLHAAQGEVSKLREQITAMSAVHAELEMARQRITMLENTERGMPGAEQKVAALEAEVKSLKDQLALSLAKASDSGRGGASIPPEVASMVAAMGPMLWGLDKAIEYLEPFSGNEEALAGHVRQLKTLAGIIKRLTAEVQA
jgi:predicted Zn finger-like uncharacterized protein